MITPEELRKTFEAKLLEALTEVITSYNIPTVFERENKSNDLITIFVSCSPNEKPPRSKKKKKCYSNNVEISFSLAHTFDLSETRYASNYGERPLRLCFIYQILEASYVQSSISRLTYWSKPLFNSVSELFSNYGIKLSLLPFEVYFDDNYVIHISKLPNFSDLRFVDESNNLLDNNSVIEEQVSALNDIDTFQQYLK